MAKAWNVLKIFTDNEANKQVKELNLLGTVYRI